ncbi:Hypothetical protein ABZS17I87_00316 [Kosakonia cowanii]
MSSLPVEGEKVSHHGLRRNALTDDSGIVTAWRFWLFSLLQRV